jgi:hypothetical protein
MKKTFALTILSFFTANCIGIHDAIKEKIIQPFFISKSTGEGTGLGFL